MFGLFKNKELERVKSELAEIKNAFNLPNDAFYGSLTPSGVTVTAENSKKSATVYACTRLLANAMAVMKLPIYQRMSDGSKQIVDHDYFWLFNEEPTPSFTAASFWQYEMASKLLKGDAFAWLKRNRLGVVQEVEPVPHECVRVKRSDNELVYLVNDGISRFSINGADMLHFAGFGFNGVRGESVISYGARNAIGNSLAADEFAAEYFTNGIVPSSVIQYPAGTNFSKDQQDALRQQFEDRYSGAGNRHKPLLLTNGGELSQVQINAIDAQLLETRHFQVTEICRAFGVPPDIVGENVTSAWGTGLEQKFNALMRLTINPYAIQMEQELNRKLWPRSSKFYVEFDRESLLAGDSKTESEVFSAALGGPGQQGYRTINEIRHKKNLPPDPNPLANSVFIAGAAPATAQQPSTAQQQTARPNP